MPGCWVDVFHLSSKLELLSLLLALTSGFNCVSIVLVLMLMRLLGGYSGVDPGSQGRGMGPGYSCIYV